MFHLLLTTQCPARRLPAAAAMGLGLHQRHMHATATVKTAAPPGAAVG